MKVTAVSKMSSPYDFNKDYSFWKRYAVQAHSRNFSKKDIYVSLQSIVENIGHRRIALACCNRERILEVGVGGGEHIGFEMNQTDLKNYTAVDIEPAFLELVKKQYPEVEAVQVDGSKLPFPDNHFTTIISSAVLEHIPDLEGTLKEIDRVLVDNGDFLVLVPRNGGLLIELFKRFVTYPTLWLKGIQRPSLIWHYENANMFNRIKVLLMKHFFIKVESPVPFARLPECFSPLHFFHCTKLRIKAGGK